MATTYATSPGCNAFVFNHACDEGDGHACPKHGREYAPHGPGCANHQFMLAKQRHEVAEQTALERSMDRSSMLTENGAVACNKHGDDFNEDCPACKRIVAIMDEQA